MTKDFDARPGGIATEDSARAQLLTFIAELAVAGVRPTEHSFGASADRRASIRVVGWGVGGCRGRWHGCEPGCELVVTTNAKLALMCEQPDRVRFSRARPRYVAPSDLPNLRQVLAAARVLLLPRPLAA
ncbi:hypothetical protein [Nocardia sp. NPDC056000]|uniref:hypothetical protein n=1 Tax=Nocardia sp. NPDC056000 TaxID=3345674 RepID=UPI0035DDB24D